MRTLILSLSLLVCSASVLAQQKNDKADLERERQATLRELEEVNQTYNLVKKDKKETLGQLSLIQRKIRLRSQMISNINNEIRYIDDNMYQINKEIYRLRGDLDTLKANYAKSLVYAYKNRSSYAFLNFIFSATNFNDAVRRVAYLKTYRTYREQQADNIVKTEALLHDKVGLLGGNKTRKGEVLQDESKERSKLEDEKQEKNQVVAQLKSKEQELATTIANKKRQLQRMQSAINAVIRREIEEANRAAIARAKVERDRKAKEEADRKAAAKAAIAANNAPAGVPASRPVTTASVNKPVGTTPAATEPATAKAASTESATTISSTADKLEANKLKRSVLLFNDADYKLANDFESNRGKLPWPVDNGYIAAHLGNNTVEGTRIEWDNPGITIGTSVNAPVKAVFEGTVSAVVDVGGVTMVTIQHGNYFSTYGNLATASVRKNEKVHTGQTIGTAAEGDTSDGQVEFILMKEQVTLNPEVWLRRKG